MRTVTSFALLAATMTLVACGRPPETATAAPEAAAVAKVEKKCPDPSITDTNDPCSPLYWKPSGSSLQNATKF